MAEECCLNLLKADDVCCKNEEGICWRVDGVDKVDADERLLKGPSEVPGIQLYLLSS